MATENFSWLLLDSNNDPIVAASPLPYVLVRRVADNFIFDWSDSAFKSSGWTSKTSNLPEVDAVNFAGLYELSLDVSSFSGEYIAYATYILANNNQRTDIQFNVSNGIARSESVLTAAELSAALWVHTQ